MGIACFVWLIDILAASIRLAGGLWPRWRNAVTNPNADRDSSESIESSGISSIRYKRSHGLLSAITMRFCGNHGGPRPANGDKLAGISTSCEVFVVMVRPTISVLHASFECFHKV